MIITLETSMIRCYYICMRKTVTLDPVVEGLVRAAMQESRKSFKELVNTALLHELAGYQKNEKPFVITETQAMGVRPGIDETDFNNVADELELGSFLEVAGKLREGCSRS